MLMGWGGVEWVWGQHLGILPTGNSKQHISRLLIEEGFIEEKAKVVAAVWGTEFIQSLALGKF